MVGEQAPTAGQPSDAGDFYGLFLANARFFSEAAQIPRVTGENHYGPRLVKRDHSEKRVERAPVSRQPGPAKQFACRASLLLVDRDHSDLTEHAVQESIAGTATQHFGES
ncbi:MAG TPA: hypothetical protein VMC83_31435 [Streptosporangiaceae bacterium]|nr:hypothetical protein [Streptosporangiaceae bacterium]